MDLGFPDAPMEAEAIEIPENNKAVDHSVAIADKLLQGWALLAETCPVCIITPLMRNRQKKVFCVACNQWILFQDEVSVSQQSEDAAKNSNRSLQNSALNLSLEQPGSLAVDNTNRHVSHGRIVSQRDESEDIVEERSPKRFAADSERGPLFAPHEHMERLAINSPTTNTRSAKLILPKVDTLPKTHDALSSTHYTLMTKVEEIQRLISVTQDVDELKVLCSLLSDFLRCILMIKEVG